MAGNLTSTSGPASAAWCRSGPPPGPGREPAPRPRSGPVPVAPFRVGEWEAHPALNRLRRNGTTVALEPRVMQLLVLLASRPGEVWSRLELMDALWGEVVVGDEGLTVAVSQLRRALADDARSPRHLESIR